jgi:hypothetical protein
VPWHAPVWHRSAIGLKPTKYTGCYDTSHLKIIFTLLDGWDAEYAVWKCDTKAGSKRVAELELQFWRAVQTEMRGLVASPTPRGFWASCARPSSGWRALCWGRSMLQISATRQREPSAAVFGVAILHAAQH